jgi:tripartite-type tricarboxylate transporter receptor subunit TctC
MKTNIITLIASAGLLTAVVLPDVLDAQSDFYRGKTIRIVHGRDAGGSGDLRVKALVPFLQKYIPGSPTIVNEFMPGGGGRKAANYIYGSAAPDGLTIGNAGGGMCRAQFSVKPACSMRSISSSIWALPIARPIIFS